MLIGTLITFLLYFCLFIHSYWDVEKKYIKRFTHPPKCGGTTVEKALGMNKLPNKYKHASLKVIYNKLTDLGYNPDEFYKFSITRNPWDRLVSWYHFIKIEKVIAKRILKAIRLKRQINIEQAVLYYTNLSFNDFIINENYLGGYDIEITEHQTNDEILKEYQPRIYAYYYHKKQYKMDYVIRLEHFIY